MLPNSVALRRNFRAMFSQQRFAASGRIPPSALARSRHTAYFVLVAAVVLFACAREPVAPTERVPVVTAKGVRATMAPVVSVGALLDSFSIGGVYTVLPRGAYWGGSSYDGSPRKEQYAGMVWKHPTGLVLPVGLPVRILAEGQYVSSASAAFQQDYCSAPSHATDRRCAVGSFTYTIHGLADGPGVMRPYEAGMGLALTWLHIAGYYERFYGLFPSAEFFRGRVPAADTASVREVHFSRNGCCYYNSWGTTAVWETYEGSWRFGAVPDDGGQAELGVPPVLRLLGPRTEAPMTASAEFTVATATGDSVTATRWWYVQAANNTFDGEPVPLVTITQPWTMQIPRYSDGQRAVFEELAGCAGRRTCTYQAMAAGAVLVQATLEDGRVLAARNTGASGTHVKITVDSTTLTYGDTTVFRVTAPGASQWSVTGYQFVPVSVAAESAVQAVRETSALRRAGLSAPQSNHTQRPMAPQPAAQPSSPAARTAETPARVTVVRGRTKAHFLDAAVACGEALAELCYDDPAQTGYEIVTAVVDGEAQRDSVLVTVVPALKLTCSDGQGVSDAKGGATVVRADTASCKASVSWGGTASIAVTGWRFLSTNGEFTLDRSGEEDPSFAIDSTMWRGPMVLSGLVSLQATVEGIAATAASQIVVTKRNWRLRGDTIAWTLDSVGTHYGDPPKADSQLGSNLHGALPNYDRTFTLIGTGPNQSLFYFAKYPFTLGFEVSYNEKAMRDSSAFRDMQPWSSTIYSNRTYCAKSRVTTDIPLVKKHEGFKTERRGSKWFVDTALYSHTMTYKAWFDSTSRDSTERVVAKGDSAIYARAERIRAKADSVANDSTKAITDKSPRNPYHTNCYFNYDPRVRIR